MALLGYNSLNLIWFTEATYVPIRDEATVWATIGYKRTFIEGSGLRSALNVNITYIAIYGGLTFDLFR